MDIFSLLFEQKTAAWTTEFQSRYVSTNRGLEPPFLLASQLRHVFVAMYKGLKTCPDLRTLIEKDYNQALEEYGHVLKVSPSNEANKLYIELKELNFDDMDALLPCGVSSADLMLHTKNVEPKTVIERLSACKWPYHVFFPVWATHQDRCNDHEFMDLMEIWIRDMQHNMSTDDVPTTPPIPNTIERKVLHAWLSQFTDINMVELEQIQKTLNGLTNQNNPELLNLIMDERWSQWQYDYPDLGISLHAWIKALRPYDNTVDLLPDNDTVLRQQWPQIKASWSALSIESTLTDFS